MFVGVNAIEHERLNVAVENDPDEFSGLVHHRAAAVAANDVGIGDEIESRFRIERRLLVDPTVRQIERRFVVVLGRALIQAREIRERRNLFPIFFVTAHCSVR